MPEFKRVQIGQLELCYQESGDGDRPLLLQSRLADIRLLWISPSLVWQKRGMDLVEAILSDQLAIAQSTGYCAWSEHLVI